VRVCRYLRGTHRPAVSLSDGKPCRPAVLGRPALHAGASDWGPGRPGPGRYEDGASGQAFALSELRREIELVRVPVITYLRPARFPAKGC